MSPAQILQQAIDDDAFNGTEPVTFGKLAVSLHRKSPSIVAIANSVGWWTMYADEIESIAAAVSPKQAVNELQIAQLIEQRDALLAACKGLLEEFGDERIPDPSVIINARAAIALAEGKEGV